MCVACDLLTGLDLDEISAAEPPPWSLHLPGDLAGLSLEVPVPATVQRLPTAPSNAHWAPFPDSADPTRLVEAALSAYETYRRAAAAGLVQAGTRWQLALPTPFSTLSRVVPADDLMEAMASLERHLEVALARIAEAVPTADLSLQWDLAAETALWEARGRDLTAGRRVAGRVLEGLSRLAAVWPAEAGLGFHLCRRDAAGTWAADPLDATQVSHLAGAVLASVDREVQFLHLPASHAVAETDWYLPLTRLQAWPETTLYLGLAWPGEAPETIRARLAAAHGALPRAIAAPACCEDGAGARQALEAALAGTARTSARA